MRGLVFLGERKVELREFADPAPGAGDVVVAIRASGMCGSDLRPYRAAADPNRPACVTGHEPCGVVAEIGAGVTDQQARVGQRVMVHHYRGCGVCKHCRVGYTQMCARGAQVMGFSANGGNAPYLLAPASSVVTLPDELSFVEGAAISCGTGTAYSALKRLGVSGRDTLAIFGQGPVGLAATQLATAMGARVIACRLFGGATCAGNAARRAGDDRSKRGRRGPGDQAADARRRRRRDARLHGPSRGARQLRQGGACVGPGMLRRRAGHRHLRHDAGCHPQAADHVRLVDLQHRPAGRMRAIRRRPRRADRSRVYGQLHA